MSVARRQLLNEKQRLSVWMKTKTETKTKTKTTPITATTAAPAITMIVPNTSTTTSNFRPTKHSQLPNDGNNSCTNTPINIHTEEGRTKLLKLITFDDDIVVNDHDEENKSSSVLEFLPYVEYDYCSISNNNNNNNNNNSNTHNNNPEDMELLEPISIHDRTAPF